MLTTERLLLHPPTIEDFEGMLAVWSLSPAPPVRRSREEVWARLLRFIGHWQVFGYGPFMLLDRATGATVGEAGFLRFERALGPDCEGAVEATWTLTADRRGEGLAGRQWQPLPAGLMRQSALSARSR